MKILCLGDSLTYGYGIHPYDPTQAWPALAAGRNQVINAGEPGMALLSGNGYWNSYEYLHAIKKHPDAVIFWLGENDSAEDIWNEKKFRQGYSLMVEELLEHAVRDHLLLIRPLFPLKEKENYDFGIQTEPLKRIDEIICETAETFGISCFDPNICFQNYTDCFSDDIHPNRKGNQILARALSDKLKEVKWE